MRNLDIEKFEVFEGRFELDQARILLPYMRPDAYFYYIIRLIVRFDFEKANIPINRVQLIDRFYYIGETILSSQLSVRLSQQYTYSYAWEAHHEQYANEIDFYRSCLQNILYDKEINQKYFNISTNLHDHEESDIKISLILQKLMLLGYLIARDRISIRDTGLISANLAPYMNEELIIYPTIDGVINLSSYNTKSKEEQVDTLSEMLTSIGVVEQREQIFLDDYKSIVSVEYDSSIYDHYLQKDDWMNSFLEKKVNDRTARTYGHWGQVNFRKLS